MEQPASPNLTSAPAVLRATIQITRAATGKVEEYTIIGTPLPAEPPQPEQPEQPEEEA